MVPVQRFLEGIFNYDSKCNVNQMYFPQPFTYIIALYVVVITYYALLNVPCTEYIWIVLKLNTTYQFSV